VLFCDLVGSTSVAAQLDPEEWRETVAGYHRTAAEAITRFGGHVAKYLGDGVMAFFGYPEAHDNDAERAARAGLAIIDAIAKLNEQPGRPKLAARVGIHSGTVVVGAGAGKDADVFGDAPNIADRVQEAAAPGTVVVTEDTHRLISGLFVVDARGAPTLKGIEQPIQLYRVIQPSGVRGRLEAAAAARGLTPFVGREDELRSLMNRWERALDGEGQVALIIGEAGIGKSRLVQRFHEQIAGTPHTWIEAAAAPFFQNTPFYLVAEMLRELLAWRGDEPAEEQLAQLEAALVMAGLQPAEAIPLITPLLNLPIPVKYPRSPLPPEQQRRRLLATLVDLALGTARVQATAIAIEDLHWADPSTMELIQVLLEQGATARLLLLCTARPEFRAQWPMRAHHTQITLNRLNARNVRTMVGQVAARKALPEETIAAVVERTGGVPLFVEELTRAVLESGDAQLTGRAIPVTLHDSLMARLDRLGAAKEVIQVGAVIGSEFSYELLHAVHAIAEEDLQRALRALADAELLYVRGIAPEATYLFKHALIRDAAYEALLKSRRKELHRQVARTIDEQFAALAEAHPEVLARHWTEADEIEPAIAQWTKAGESAQARNAFKEALESYRTALMLVNRLPESAGRDLRELRLRRSMVGMLSITIGYAAPETIDAVERAAPLAEKSSSLAELIHWVGSRAVIAGISGDWPAAVTLADEALQLALREGNPERLANANGLELISRVHRGDLAGAEKHFTAWLRFCDDPSYRQHPTRGFIPVFWSASRNAWLVGRADLARQRMALLMAGVDRSNPYDLAFSGCSAAALSFDMREYEQAAALAGRALELAEKNQFPQIVGMLRCVLGSALAQLGRAAEGVGLIRQGIKGLLEIGARAMISQYTACLAGVQDCQGAIADALETVEQALKVNPDERDYRPETLRLRGELRLKQGHTDLAEVDFLEAIALARSLGAKAWELRATMSLARLLDKRSRRDEARSLLADIYLWFSEGFDTADLRDAKALLDELSA
jgi:class 3 adenylate cyclase/tetratricopeptide (TPR) repeat protein